MNTSTLATILTLALFLLAPQAAQAQFAYNPYEGETKREVRQQNTRHAGQTRAANDNYDFSGRGGNAGRLSGVYRQPTRAPASRRSTRGGYRRASRAPRARPSSTAAGGPRGNGLFGSTTAAVVAQTVSQMSRMLKQLNSARNQFTTLKNQYKQAKAALRQLSNLNLRNLDQFLSQSTQLLAAGGNLAATAGQSAGQLQREINRNYPVFQERQLVNQDAIDSFQSGMKDVSNTFQFLRKQSQQINQAQQRMRRVARQLNNASNPTQVKEAAATLQQFQVQNGQMTRQLLMRMIAGRKKRRAQTMSAARQTSLRLKAFNNEDIGTPGGSFGGGSATQTGGSSSRSQPPTPTQNRFDRGDGGTNWTEAGNP